MDTAKRKTYAESHKQHYPRLREEIRVELHNSERRLERRIKKAISDAAATRERMIRLLRRGKRNEAETNLIGKDEVRSVARMVGELYGRMSGTSSDVGEQYLFKDGGDARLLSDVQQRLSCSNPSITKADAKAVSLLYKKFCTGKA